MYTISSLSRYKILLGLSKSLETSRWVGHFTLGRDGSCWEGTFHVWRARFTLGGALPIGRGVGRWEGTFQIGLGGSGREGTFHVEEAD